MGNELVLILPRDVVASIKGSDINELLEDRLPKVEESLKAERETFLKRKIEKLEEKLEQLEAELEDVREFYRKALKDREIMKTELQRIQMENAELKKKMEEKRGKQR